MRPASLDRTASTSKHLCSAKIWCVTIMTLFILLGVTVLNTVAVLLSMALVYVKLGGKDQLAIVPCLPQSHLLAMPVIIVTV